MKKLLLWTLCGIVLPGILAALEITLAAPADGATVPLLNTAQKAFLDLPRTERIAFFADAEKRKQLKEAGYLPLPVFFAWKSDASQQAEFRVILAKSPDMTGTIAVPGKEGAAKIDNRTMSAYERIRASVNNHLAVVGIYNGDACGGCFNTITPQRRVEIASNRKLIICEHCGRIIINPDFE